MGEWAFTKQLPSVLGRVASALSLSVVLSDEQEAMLAGTGSTGIGAIAARIPTALGQAVKAASFAVTLASDQATRLAPLVFQLVGYSPAPETVRTFSGAVADTEPPTLASTWVPLVAGQDSEVEWFSSLTAISGATAPSQVTLRLWARTTGDVIRMVDEVTMDTAQWLAYSTSKAHRPRVCQANAGSFCVTASFPDGATQTITGTVVARTTNAGHALTRAGLLFNEYTKHLLAEIRGYDSVSDLVRMMETSPFWLNNNIGLIESTAGAVVGNTSTYFPSSSGMEIDGAKTWHTDFAITAGNASAITVVFEFSNDPAFTTPVIDCTLAGIDLQTGLPVLAADFVIAALAAGVKAVEWDNPGFKYFRMKATAAGAAASSACTIYMGGIK